MSANKSTTSKESRPQEYGANSPLTYNKYLQVPELLQLQVCQSEPPHHDEPLFIIIHQTYELWFKLILHELDEAAALIEKDQPRRAAFYLRRVVAIMKVLVGQIHILETMAPRDFLGFRHKLNPASGFQSSQFREVEFAAGLKDLVMLKHFESDKAAHEHLLRRFEAPSLRDLFFDLLRRNGFDLPPDELQADEPSLERARRERVMALKALYDDSDKHVFLLELAEQLIEIDELLTLWRTHHMTVVERVIGFKRGTGGSEGVAYLRSTITKRCFPELWQVRTVLEVD